MMTNEIHSICIFLFYNKAQGKQVKYIRNKKYLHCNIISFDGSDCHLLEITTSGIECRRIKSKSMIKVFERLKSIDSIETQICVSVSNKHKVKWFPLAIKSCNEFCRYVSGVNIGFTYDPFSLYKKLLKYNNKRNFEILRTWERRNG